MTVATDYCLAVRNTASELAFEIRGAGVRTILFSVENEDTVAWCMEPPGAVGPFAGAIREVGPLTAVPIAEADAPDDQSEGSTTEDTMPELSFTYGTPPGGSRTALTSPATQLIRGNRYVALAVGISDRGVEHASIAFTAR